MREREGALLEIRYCDELVPVLVNEITNLEGYFTWVAYWVYIQNIQDHSDQSSLRTTSLEALGVRAAVSKAENHLPVLEIAQDDSEEPLGDFEDDEDSHDDVMVNFVESLGPVSKKVDNSFGLVWIIRMFQNKINYGDKCMRAGGSWQSKLSRIIVLRDVVKETFHRVCTL